MANKKRKASAVSNKRTSNKKQPLHYSVHIVILSLVAILMGIFLYTNGSGILTVIIKEILFSLFSVSAYLIPIILAGLAIYICDQKRIDKLTIKLVLSLVGCVILSALYQIIFEGALPYSDLITYGASLVGGGLFGGIIANILTPLIPKAASIIILIFALVAIISLLIKVSVFSMLAGFFQGLFKIGEEISEVDYKGSKNKGEKAANKVKKSVEQKKKNIDFSIGDDEPQKEEKPSKAKIEEIIYKPDIPIEDNEEEEEDITIGATLDDVKDEIVDEENKGTGNQRAKRVDAITEEEKIQINEEMDDAIEKVKVEYVYPPIDLLAKPKAASADKRREMQETANKLMEILKNFGVEAKLLQVTQGPSVTRYEIQPNTGVKLSKITGLAEDIALNLAVPTVLVAAVPGKAAVGIEVPNTSVNTVAVRELMESTKFREATSKLTVALGKDIGGNVVVGDIAKMPHVLIAGSTGSGKSVCINTIITSILYKASPDEVKLIMVDPKVVELGVYNGIPHLMIPVVTDPKRAAGALNWAVGEMMRRYALFADSGTRNLTGYNEYVTKTGEEKLPQIVIIIDELADLMMVAAKEVEDYICRLAQLARAAGIHLIVATQRPSVDVITGLIKANVPSRIAFAVSSQVDSRTILDKGGAEKLLGKGDMLYHPTGLSNALRVQGAFVSDQEVEKLVSFIKEHSEVTHYAEDIAEHLDRMASGDISSEENSDDDDADALLPQAIDLAVELGQISTAMIQRRLKVGYARAGRIIDQMEMRGIISGANGSKPREVYMNRINTTDFE
ncbi:MAG: DNA translocase FtsK 4TM domain-containing protein [Clostridia bacterium]|nr:DNA translocase FtsK 4TM domain-containing protein [Clostridia bacterium]